MSAVTQRELVLRARATAGIAERMRKHDAHDAWGKAGESTRRAVASRLLDARLRLNRAGHLRWRREVRR